MVAFERLCHYSTPLQRSSSGASKPDFLIGDPGPVGSGTGLGVMSRFWDGVANGAIVRLGHGVINGPGNAVEHGVINRLWSHQ